MCAEITYQLIRKMSNLLNLHVFHRDSAQGQPTTPASTNSDLNDAKKLQDFLLYTKMRQQ